MLNVFPSSLALPPPAPAGVLCITCTDTSVLCGVYPETCYSKYGSVSLRLKCGHEMVSLCAPHNNCTLLLCSS